MAAVKKPQKPWRKPIPMDIDPLTQEILKLVYAKLEATRTPVYELQEVTGVATATLQRWRDGTNGPTLACLRGLLAYLNLDLRIVECLPKTHLSNGIAPSATSQSAPVSDPAAPTPSASSPASNSVGCAQRTCSCVSRNTPASTGLSNHCFGKKTA